MGHQWTIVVLIGCALWTVVNLEPIPTKKQCGTRSNNLGIYYGELANKNEFPWQVSLHYQWQNRPRHNCGGSIISDNWIITAAHCVWDLFDVFPANKFSVLIGTLNNTDGRRIQAKRIIAHPEYDFVLLINDLALIELAEPIGLDQAGDNINSICLGQPEDVVDGREMVVTGWGQMEDKTFPVMLRKATVRVENLDYCKKMHKNTPNSPIVDGQVCTTSKPDTCQGDSGGPLQYSNKDGRWYLIGLTSWGIGCGLGKSPAVYTRVPYYLDFIQNVTNIQGLL